MYNLTDEMHKSIDDRIDEIYALSHIMYLLFMEVENEQIRVNPHAVARFGKMIVYNVIKIVEYLDAKP